MNGKSSKDVILFSLSVALITFCVELFLSLYFFLAQNNRLVPIYILIWSVIILGIIISLLASKFKKVEELVEHKNIKSVRKGIISSIAYIGSIFVKGFESIYNNNEKTSESKNYWYYVVIAIILNAYVFNGSIFCYNYVGVENIEGDSRGVLYNCENKESIKNAAEAFKDYYDESPDVAKFIFKASGEFVGYRSESVSKANLFQKFLISTSELIIFVLLYNFLPAFIVASLRAVDEMT